jgi:tetratricopeptide (TPR) repeat protein
MMLFLKAVTAKRRRGLYIAGLFLASLLGMGARENFATFPLMLLLYDACFISGFSPRRMARNYKAYAPALLSLGYMAHLALNNTYGKSSVPGGIPPAEYALTELNVHWTYIRLLLFPVNQTLDYDYPVPKSILEFRTMLALVGYAGLWITAAVFARRRPLISFLTLWFVVILLPISFAVTLLDLRLDDVIFEHRLYLPGAGPLVLASLAIWGAAERARRRWTHAGMAIAAASVLGVLLLTSGTYARNNAWKSEISLWQDVVSKSPEKARAHNNLGMAYYQNIEADKAIAEYEAAIRLDPNYHLAYNNLGVIYGARGQTDKRIAAYRKAVSIDPTFAQAHINLGSAYLTKGQVDKAIYHLQTALEMKPSNAKAHSLISQAYERKGLTELAERHRRLAERGR